MNFLIARTHSPFNGSSSYIQRKKCLDMIVTTIAIVQITSVLATMAGLVVAMICDMRKYILPNFVSIIVSISFLVFACLTMTLEMMMFHVMTATLIFAICFFFYLKKAFGAGDVKLLSAISLWAGPSFIMPVLFIVTLLGGLLSIFLIVVSALRQKPEETGQQKNLLKIKIPYGLAIGCGGLFLMASYLNNLIS